MPLSANAGREDLFSSSASFPLVSSRTVGDILRKAIVPLSLTDTLADALRWMDQYRCFTVPVVQSVEVERSRRILKGFLDCRMLFKIIGSHFASPVVACQEAFRKPLFQIMQNVPKVMTPHSSLAETIQHMIEHRRDLLPVTDEEGFVGVVTMGDILDEFIGRRVICNVFFEMDNLKLSIKQMDLQELERRPPHVGKWLPLILTPPLRFRREDTLKKAVTAYQKKDVFLIPVYDSTEHLTGTLSRLDIIRGLLRVSEQGGAEDCQKMYHTLPLEQLAGDTCGSISIQATVNEAAEQIRMSNLCGLSVLSEEQHLCGFITPCSLLPALASGCLLGSFPEEKERL